VAIGTSSLASNTTASNNTAVGYQAGYSNTTGTENSFVGRLAGYSTTTGSYNTAFGTEALRSNTTGRNTAIGTNAGYGITTGTFNQCFGDNAGASVTTGSKNTIVGCYSGNQGGLDIRTASNSIVLSDGDGNPRLACDSVGNWFINATSSFGAAKLGIGGIAASTNGIGLRNATYTGGTLYSLFLHDISGNFIGGITNNNTSTSFATTSDYRLKKDVVRMTGALEKVSLLKPVTYTWKSNNSVSQGFIAHELQDVVPECVVGEKDAVDAQGKPIYQGIDTSYLVATLTAAIQELKAEVDSLKQQLNGA
jgi:hypothetical protein